MKKTTSTIAIMAAMAVFTTSGLFAQPKPVSEKQPLVRTAQVDEKQKSEHDNRKKDAHSPKPVEKKSDKVRTVAVSVNVVTRKNVTNIFLKTNDGRTYVADSMGPEGQKAIETLRRRNGKKTVVSGVLNESTGVFNVIKIGNMEQNHHGDEK